MTHGIIALRTPECKSCLIAKKFEKEINNPMRENVTN
jgi:hypothetical protein